MLESAVELHLENPLQRGAVAHTVKQIRIEGARDAIHSVEIQQADGDRSVLTIGPEVAQ